MPFLLALFALTGIIFSARSLKLLNLVVNKDVPFLEIVSIFLYALPPFLELAIPIALLFGIITGFGRLSSDSEIIVLRASGVNLNTLLKPTFIFSIFVFLFSLFVSTYMRPWANQNLATGIFEIAKRRASAGLVAGVFNDFGPLTIYAEQISRAGEAMKHTVISDSRDSSKRKLFIAKNGELLSNPIDRVLNLRLYNGQIHEDADGALQITGFDVNNIRLPYEDLFEQERSGKKKEKEKSIFELRQTINSLGAQLPNLGKKENKALGRHIVEFNMRFALPVLCLIVPLLGISLGIHQARSSGGGTAFGVSLGVSSIILFYLVLAIVKGVAETQPASAPYLIWLPNLVIFSLGIFLYRQLRSEKWFALTSELSSRLSSLLSKFGA